MTKSRISGCIYLNKNRWWWRVKLPGENKPKARALRPVGAKFATRDRAVAEEVAKHMWQQTIFESTATDTAITTIAGLIHKYLQYVKSYYRKPSREPENIRYALIPLLEHCPHLPVDEFTPLTLKDVQQRMVEKGWMRGVVNKRIGMIKKMFKWAESELLVPRYTYSTLCTVEGLRRGRSGAREPEPVAPVAEVYVYAILPYTTRVVAAMIELQLLTGARSSEICQMCPCDIETSGKVWYYKPTEHKGKYRGHSKIIPIGPRAQKILGPFLTRRVDAFCFTPAESEAQRPNSIRHNKFNDRYDRTSYRRAVQYAIKAANKDRDKDKQIPFFTCHQLRHACGKRVRKELGLDAAKALLGHRTLKMTDHYSELDEALATKAALQCG